MKTTITLSIGVATLIALSFDSSLCYSDLYLEKENELFVICRQKEELIKELSKSDKEAKETKKQFSEKIKSMKQELEKAKREVEESKKTLEEYENKANYEVAEKQKVELEYKKKLQAMETKLQALKRKQKVWVEFKYLYRNNRLNRKQQRHKHCHT